MPRWLKKLWHGFLILFLGGMLLFLSYALYGAWAYHSVYVSRPLDRLFDVGGWVSYDAHPAAFWCTISIDAFAWLLFAALTVFAAWANRREARLLRDRTTRAPIENAIRQTASER